MSERVGRILVDLRRDSGRGDSDDTQRQVDLCRIMWWMRHLVLLGATAIAGWDGGATRSLNLLVMALAIDLANHWTVARRPDLVGAVITIDTAVLIGLAWLGLSFPVVLVLSVAMLAWAATFRPLAAIAAYLGALVAAWTAYARGVGVVPLSAMVGFALLGTIFIVRMIRLNMGARRAAEREHIVAEGVDAIIWEAIPGRPGALKVSAAAYRLLGYRVSDFESLGFVERLVHPDDVELADQTWSGRSTKESAEFRLLRSDGEYRWFENRTSLVGRGAALDHLVVGVLTDRTDQLLSERNSLTLGHLMDSSPIGQIMLCRRDGAPRIEALNAACRTVLGIPGDAVGRSFDCLVEERLAQPLLDLVGLEGAGRTAEVVGVDGRIYQATGRRLDESSCSIDFLDVTERVEHGQRLHRQARQDELTGLLNRRGLLELLEEHVTGHPAESSALVLLDLDDFKEINDSLGHATGDLVLRSVGERILAGIRIGDVAARLGGDEYAVLFRNVGGDVAVERGRELWNQLNQPVDIGDLRLRVRASVGLASFPEDACDAAELVRRADVAMYTAKNGARGVVRYDPSADPFDRDRLALAADLEDAIRAGDLVLHHQPVIEADTGELIGTEALVRWSHPRLGLIPPIQFIEIAEVSGLIRPLTRWVVRRALVDLAALDQLTPRRLKVSVNLSVRNLYEHDLIEWFEATMAELAVDPAQLVVEITESMIMDDPIVAIEALDGLRRLGIRTWIDDFGTGHSSFSRLRSLPVDGVKIDRSFVSGATESASDRIVLRSLIELVRSLGLRSIAEGVEAGCQLELLRSLGCDYVQGFHIARPMPLEQLLARVEQDERDRAA